MSLKDMIMKNKAQMESGEIPSGQMIKDEYINYKADNYTKIKRLNELLLMYHRDHDMVKTDAWKEYQTLQKELSFLPEIEEKLATYFGVQGASEFKKYADIEVIKEAYKRNRVDKAYTFESMQSLKKEKDGIEDTETEKMDEKFNEILTKNKILEEELAKILGEEAAIKFMEETEKYVNLKVKGIEVKEEEVLPEEKKEQEIEKTEEEKILENIKKNEDDPYAGITPGYIQDETGLKYKIINDSEYLNSKYLDNN